MSAVAIIACDHGLGHVRRSVLNAEALQRAGAEVTLLAPAAAVARIRTALELGNRTSVEVLDFATETSPAALRAALPRTTRWHERLPDLGRFDHVIVDTLPEVLELRPDAVLVAQFLWHDALDGIDPEVRRRTSELAGRAHLVIGSVPFVMPAVRALPGFHAVGLHVRDTLLEPAGSGGGRDLLIAGGATDALREGLRDLVEALVRRGPGPFGAVHVDAEVMPSGAPSWLRRAEHTPAMYDALQAAVIRPGLGTLTELLARRVHVHCVREPGSTELAHNTRVVVELGVGDDLGVPRAELAGRIVDGRGAVHDGSDPRTGLRFDGGMRTAELVLQGPAGPA